MLINSITLNLIFICSALANQLSPVVETEDGPIRGLVKEYEGVTVYRFLGIPYAKPPVGRLRFLQPERVQKRNKVLKATRIGKGCLQRNVLTSRATNTTVEKTSEDCLFLNIICQEKAVLERSPHKLRPVMVFIHGGAFHQYSGADYPFLNNDLVAREDVVLVTMNYRLNVFGFIYHEKYQDQFPGNLGLWDQNMALRWTKNNIINFGGDPNGITVFGQSAGGQSISFHLISPFAKNLFKRAILESGAGLYLQRLSNLRATESTQLVLERTGCALEPDKLNCLQQLDATTLLETIVPTRLYPFDVAFNSKYIPVSHDEVLLDKQLPISDVDLLIGVTKDDSSFEANATFPQAYSGPEVTFSDALNVTRHVYKSGAVDTVLKWYFPDRTSPVKIRRGITDIFTDLAYRCPSWEFARRLSAFQKQGNSYAYILAHRPAVNHYVPCIGHKQFGVCHEDELQFVFGSPFSNYSMFTDADRTMSTQFMNAWASFARTG